MTLSRRIWLYLALLALGAGAAAIIYVSDKPKEGASVEMEQTNKPVTVFLAGDSTVQSYTAAKAPLAGWGQMLGGYFKESATIRNYAISGRSSKSFVDEGNLSEILNEIGAGDYLLIQFAHNDEKKDDPKRYTEPDTSYKVHLNMYIDGAREKGAFPVLITPMERRNFKGAKVQLSHGSYPEAMTRLGNEKNVPVLPLHKLSIALYERLGEEGTKPLFLWLNPGEHPNYPEGSKDNTHFNERGANEMAKLIVRAIREAKLPLASYLKPE